MKRFAQNFLKILDWPFKILAVILINIYRYTLSSIAGRTCRHFLNLPAMPSGNMDFGREGGLGWPGLCAAALEEPMVMIRCLKILAWMRAGIFRGNMGAGNRFHMVLMTFKAR